MKVKELVQWLAAFEDQEADVEVVCHSSGRSYYDQGGNATASPFDPATHATYTDMRGNRHVKAGAPWENSRTLLLGELNA